MPYADPEKKRAHNLKYREKNLARMKKYQAERRRTKADAIRAQKRRWYEKNRAHVVKKSKAWAEANLERRREIANEWARRNLPYMAERCSARRAHLLATAGDSREVQAFYWHVHTAPDITCHYCKKPVIIGRRHVDHVIPLSKGGLHALSNLVASCDDCNWKKNAKMPA